MKWCSDQLFKMESVDAVVVVELLQMPEDDPQKR